MNYEVGQLQRLLARARRRRRLLIGLRGAAVCVGVGACVLLLLGWAAYRYRGSEGALLALRVGALSAFVAAVGLSLVRPLARRISDARLARFIEERARGTEDRLVTAVEFAEGEEARRVSRALLERLRSDADGAAASVDLDRVFSRRALAAYGAAALASLLFFAGVLKWGPRGVSEGVAQLVAPTGLAAEADARAIKVKPGTTRVPKGSDQEIKAALAGFDAETASLFTRSAGAGEDAWQGQAMEQAKARGEFQLSLFNVQESAEYFVESEGVRSEVFRLEVVDLPFVKQLDLVLNFPAFSRLPAKAVEDGGDVAALKGTVVAVTARLSGRARAARIVFADGRRAEMKAAGPDFVGALTVTGDTSYFIELTSLDGETYRGSNEFDVTALEDQPPTVSFERPGRDTKATNLEEVFTQARAEDDFGVAAIELFFSVNGGEEQRVNLQDLSRDAARSLTGTHTFFIEEFKLKPGDFISYYAKARDASNETTSDIYFIEVKPFEMQYKQAQSGQQGGGGDGEGADQDQNALTRRQKELIAATHRLMREGQRYTPQERADGYGAVAEGQEKLKADTLEFLERVRRRMGEQLEGREELSRMAEDLLAAAREMEGAPPPLRKQAGRDALPPEQRALQRLLSADAIFREMQVAFGNQSGGGGGGRESKELSDLMELELDKMKNQYETLNREQRQRQEQAKSEAERRLEELARRQERALEEQRRRQQGQQGQPRNGSSGGGSERQQQEMVEEARRAARELERLSRERRDARMQELSRQMDQAADDLQRAQSSAKGGRQDSIAQGERALERTRQAQRRLQQMRGGGSAGQQGQQQEIGSLRQRASEAAARQRELAREAEQLARRGPQGSQQGQGEESARAARERLAEREQALSDSVNNLEEDARQTARALGEGKQQAAARRLGEAADALRRNRVAERIREGSRGAEQGRPESAREAGRAAQQGLGEMSERLQEAEAAAGRPAGKSAEDALDRTRQLADDLDSLRRKLEERASRRGRQSQGGQQQSQGSRQPGGRQGQQQGREQSAQQQSQAGQEGQGGQQGSRSQQSAQQSGGGGGGGGRGGDVISGTGADEARQLASELRERMRDAERLRSELGGTSAGRELGGAIEQLRGMADGRLEGESQTAASLKAAVIDPLRQLELELSKRLREQLGRTNLRLGDEGAAPGRYRKSVEEYYRRLSQGGRR